MHLNEMNTTAKKIPLEETNNLFLLGHQLGIENTAKRKPWKKIFLLWKEAGLKGHTRAQFYLGTCYDFGLGVEKNIEEAFNWYLKAAKKGHMESQYNIGFCYLHGDYVAQNNKTAVYWYKKAAIKNDDRALYNLGLCYKNGTGVTQSKRWAKYYFFKASKFGHKLAKRQLKNI